MDGNINFRKAKIGGFNKKDVISYIEKMRNDFFDYKTAVESTIDTLNAKINELEALMSEKDEISAEAVAEPVAEPAVSSDPLTNINEATSQLKMVADELCRNLSVFMSKIKTADTVCEQQADVFENTEAYIEETAKEIFENEPEQAVSSKEDDKVLSILRSSLNFSFDASKTDADGVNETASEKHNVLESFNKSSFFC